MKPTTDPSEFDKWIACFPSEMRKGLWFIPISPLAKEPAIPRNESWKDEKFRLTIAEARQRLEVGGNIGVVASKGNVGFLDIEYKNIPKAKPHVPNELVDTLIDKTRDAGLHLNYINEDVENRDLRINGELLVEARMENRYVLAPGSFVPPSDGSPGNGLYHVVNERPPLTLKREMLSWFKEPETTVYKEPIDFSGSFMSLPCIKVLFEVKLNHGRKIHASKLLGIAWAKDHDGRMEGLAPIAQRFAAFQNHPDFPMSRRGVCAWAQSVARNKREWSCGEMITLLRDNGIFPPCSGCPVKEVQ